MKPAASGADVFVRNGRKASISLLHGVDVLHEAGEAPLYHHGEPRRAVIV
jgi:hypothetical protein